MKRNKFSLSHYKLFSCDMGELIPITWFEVLPGDTIQMSTSALVRAAALLSPVMHRVDVRIHHWYVPYRLIWDDFEKFITGGADGLDASVYPTYTFNTNEGTLADYLGVPPNTVPLGYSALPHRAYGTIYNEWYRDEDLQAPLVVSTASGPDTTTSGALKSVNWEKDYLTSSRPWEQKGPTVTLPLGTTAPVISNAANVSMRDAGGTLRAMSMNATGQLGLTGGTTSANINWGVAGATTTGLTTDLSTASSVTINTLRQALAIQRFEEARARYGSRYTEYLRYLGIRSSDARLQRPEYLGGGRQTIQFSEVLQTAPTTSGSAAGVADMKGHGIGAMRSNRFRRFIEEHGLIMSLMSVRPKTIYTNGLPRAFNRRTKTDFFQTELQNLGQQAILNKEVRGIHATPDGTFGYQDRYDEYRRMESSVAGEFRSTLNFWHMARDFSSDPALNSTFVTCVPTERTFAVPASDVLYVQANHSIQARRMLSPVAVSKTF